MKKINNIIFDFNGTLLDDGYLCYSIEAEMQKMKGIEPVSFDFYRDNFCHPITKYYDKIGFSQDKYNFKELADYFYVEYKKREKSEAKLFPGSIDLLKKLKRDGYKIYILSATEINLLTNQLKELGILEYFDELIAARDENAVGKIEYGKEFVLSHSLNKENAILIGDTTHDYETSEALNINILLFDQGHNSRKALNVFNKPIVSSYKEIEEYIYNLD